MKLVHLNLFQSIESNRITEVNHCLKGGANPNAKWKGHKTLPDGWSPLHAAATSHPLITKILLNAGARYNHAVGKHGTPLHITNHVDIAKLLLEAGADVSAKNSKGDTPLMTQKKLGNKDIVSLLESHLASQILQMREQA